MKIIHFAGQFRRTVCRSSILRIMKLTVAILIIGLTHVTAAINAQITIKEKNIPLQTALKTISQQSGYDFIYSDQVFRDAHPVTLNLSNAPIETALNLCFKDQPLTYKIEDKTVMVRRKEIYDAKTNINSTFNAPQAHDVTIHVTDSTGQPLIGATVKVSGTGIVGQTDDNGNIKLKLNVSAIVSVSYVGYESQTFEIGEGEDFLIRLKIKASSLQEVAILNSGYQRIPKDRATGSFAFVDNQLFNKRVSADVISRLEGNVPGLLFNRNTTALGSKTTGGYDLNIRGHGTLFSNDQPLVVVDNFAYDGDIRNINPNDIESITVLKDAAAASIWGVRSGNGVIVITTKKGRKKQPLTINVNANVTVTNKPNLKFSPDFLDSKDYINIEKELYTRGYYNGALADLTRTLSPVVDILSKESKGQISTEDANIQLNKLGQYDVRNQLSQYFYRKPISQQYSINFSGGADKSDYYLSLGYDGTPSQIIGNRSNKITISSNYNLYPTKKLQFNFGLNYILNHSEENGNSNTIPNIPYLQLVGSNGQALSIPDGLSNNYKDSMVAKGLLDWQLRPYDELKYHDNRSNTTDNRINIGMKYDLIDGLDLELRYQYERLYTNNFDLSQKDAYQVRDLVNRYTKINSDGSLEYPIPNGGILNTSNTLLLSHQVRGQLNYNKNWQEKSRLSAIAGVEIRGAVTQNDLNTAYGYDAETQTSATAIDYQSFFLQNPFGSRQIYNGQSFDKRTSNFVSYFSNAAYTLSNLYTFSASGRIDKSNFFGLQTNQKAVPLYSLGFSWNISNEKFYHLEYMPYLKSRITYGYNGNLNQSATAVATISYRTNSPFTNMDYAELENPANPELRWERQRMINIGIDFGLKRNIITGSIEYYHKRGLDLFGGSPLSPTSGLTSFFGNTASTKGHGFDIVINSQNISTKNFEWNTSFLFSYAVDKVTNYDVKSLVSQYIQSNNASQITPLIGSPVFAIYSYQWAGLDHETGDPLGYVNGVQSKDYGDILNSNSLDSLNYNGPARPTTFGSLRNTITYKQLSLSFNIIYKFNYFFRRSSISDASGIGMQSNGNEDYKTRWQKPGDEKYTQVPSFLYSNFDPNREQFYQYSSALIEKGDNVRLQDITLNYDFPLYNKSIKWMKGLSLYGYISNIGILWRANDKHLDPDLSSDSGIPAPITYSLGIKIKL